MKLILTYIMMLNFTLLAQDTMNVASEFNKTVYDSTSQKDILFGHVTREVFKDTAYSKWFDAEYEKYELDTAVLNEIKTNIYDKEFVIVMATWCSDSRQQVPRFYKILDYLKINDSKIKVTSVDRKRKDGTKEIEELDIQKVPTFILFKDGFEEGRIIETPNETLEKDLQKILNRI